LQRIAGTKDDGSTAADSPSFLLLINKTNNGKTNNGKTNNSNQFSELGNYQSKHK